MERYLQKRLKSFRYAGQGIWAAVLQEAHLQLHLAATAVVCSLGVWLGLARWEWAAIILAIGLVWVAELLNTALEAWVDLVSPEHNTLAGKSKDIAAGAVLAATVAVAIGLLVFLPHL
jgi:diacylglycerol kinase (ATP)